MTLNGCRTRGKGSLASPSRSLLGTNSRCFSADTLTYSAGGIVVIGGKGKIVVDNTLEARLALLKELGLPAVRGTLFGENENRRFFD